MTCMQECRDLKELIICPVPKATDTGSPCYRVGWAHLCPRALNWWIKAFSTKLCHGSYAFILSGHSGLCEEEQVWDAPRWATPTWTSCFTFHMPSQGHGQHLSLQREGEGRAGGPTAEDILMLQPVRDTSWSCVQPPGWQSVQGLGLPCRDAVVKRLGSYLWHRFWAASRKQGRVQDSKAGLGRGDKYRKTSWGKLSPMKTLCLWNPNWWCNHKGW